MENCTLVLLAISQINDIPTISRQRESSVITGDLGIARSERWNLPAGFAVSARLSAPPIVTTLLPPPLPHLCLPLNAKNACRSGSVPTILINSATSQEDAADLTLYQKGLPTNVSACVRECVRAWVYAFVLARFSRKRPHKCVRVACVHEKSRGTTSREGQRGEPVDIRRFGKGGMEGWGRERVKTRGDDAVVWIMVRGKRHPDSRERRATTRLPRGAQRFASLPGSLQALTHQQSLPPPVRALTRPSLPPGRARACRPHSVLHPSATCRSAGSSPTPPLVPPHFSL